MKRISAIILAGGYGFFRGPKRNRISKVTAHLNGKAMICHILDNLKTTKLFSRFFVVTNQDYHEQIRQVLENDSHYVHFVIQPHRLGTAGAVELALPHLQPDEEDALITYADMPHWESGTYRLLVERHRTEYPKLTMVTVPLVPGSRPETYGRIVFDEAGKLLGTIDDPNCVPEGVFQKAKEVNPSLYVGHVPWLRETIPHIPPFNKGDGHPDERLMQSLIHIAYRQQAPVAQVRIDDYEQAHGINNLPELRLARQLYQRRRQEVLAA